MRLNIKSNVAETWTKQQLVLLSCATFLKTSGKIVTLQYKILKLNYNFFEMENRNSKPPLVLFFTEISPL